MKDNKERCVNAFFSHLQENRKTSQNTLSAYKRDISSFFDFLDSIKKDFTKINDKEISQYKTYLAEQGKSVSTVSRCMSTLRTFYKFLVVNGDVSVNPAVAVKNDKTEKKFFEVLTEDEIDKLLMQPDSKDFKGKRDRAMLEVLYATGMKVSELMALNLCDVNTKMHCIHCGISKERVVLLYPKAVKLIEDYISKSRNYFVAADDEEALFVNTNGERMTRQGFWKILKGYAENAGISKSITPHTLRHSFATHLLENGADINDIKNILGHADISSTQVYSDFIKSKLNNTYLKFNHRSK